MNAPCPFCDSVLVEAREMKTKRKWPIKYRVVCERCGALGPKVSRLKWGQRNAMAYENQRDCHKSLRTPTERLAK